MCVKGKSKLGEERRGDAASKITRDIGGALRSGEVECGACKVSAA